MRIITLLCEKGGVGKTTLSVHLAAGLAMKGWRTLLLDTDEQGHCTTALGMEGLPPGVKPDDPDAQLVKLPGFFDLLGRNEKWVNVLLPVPGERYQEPGPLIPTGRLSLLPSNVLTRALPYTISPRANQLAKRLHQLRDAIDFVVIDTAPAASLLHLLILAATDYVLLPSKLETLSFDGIRESMAHLQNANEDRAERQVTPIEVLGIVPTMYRRGTIEHESNLSILQEHYGDLVWAPIPLRTVWPDAMTQRWTVFGLAPGSEAANDAWDLVDRVEAGVMAHV